MRSLHPRFGTLLALLCAVLTLTACGAGQTPPTPPAGGAGGTVAMRDPAAVNAAWVRAINGNDRAAALALVDPRIEPLYREHFVDSLLQQFQTYKAIPAGDVRWPGAFRQVETLDVQASGGTQQGYSRWIFSTTLCFYTDMVPVEGTWRVRSWYQAAQASQCDPPHAQ